MMKQTALRQISQRHPDANDLLRGWHAAEAGFAYDRSETDDWQMGWRLWHQEHGQARSSHTRH
jgi:hypothetical protein